MSGANDIDLSTREICAKTREQCAPELSEQAMSRWYRWGWVPLVAGCVVIVAAILVGCDLWMTSSGLVERDPEVRALYLARAVVTSFALAAWAGWFVLRSRKRIEAAREQLREQQAKLAQQEWRAKQQAGLGALSRILAHEIRNPLNSMALHCALLRRSTEQAEPERVREIADLLRGEITRLDQLVHEYLLYSNGPPQVQLAPTDLGQLARTVLGVLQPILDEHHISAALHVEPGTPRALADAGRVEQVLHNLVRNAMAAQGKGGAVNICVRPDGERVQLEVTDRGPGFDDPAAVFRPFYATKRGGSGLGLAIVRDVVRAHGGEVEAGKVDSGHGARIRIRLPREGAAS